MNVRLEFLGSGKFSNARFACVCARSADVRQLSILLPLLLVSLATNDLLVIDFTPRKSKRNMKVRPDQSNQCPTDIAPNRNNTPLPRGLHAKSRPCPQLIHTGQSEFSTCGNIGGVSLTLNDWRRPMRYGVRAGRARYGRLQRETAEGSAAI